MSDPTAITQLYALLATERTRLGILLEQVALHGWANALPAQISGIAEARSEIARLKAELRRLGETVADEANDQESEEERAQAAASGRGQGSVEVSGQVNGPVVGVNTGHIHYHVGNTSTGDVSGIGNAIGDHAQSYVTINQTLLRPLPVNLRSLVQPLIDHYSADLFGGREAELAMLDSFLADPDQPYGLLVAPTGLGKTALLIHWIARLQAQQPQCKIIFAPISIRYQTASELTILGILAHSLAEVHHDLEAFRSYDQSAQSLRALIGDYLRRPLPEGMLLLLVLDAIDEATGCEVGPLCAIAPQTGLKIVISARQRANRTREDWRFHLGWNTFPVAQLDLHQLGRSAVAAFLAQNKLSHANDPAFVDQFYRVSEGDPLTCNLLLKALISGDVTVDSLTQRPPGLEAFLKGWVEVLRKRRKASAPIRELLALCAVAYGPLSGDDLQALAPEIFEEQGDIVDAAHDDEVARFIITVGEQQTYVFSHQRLREVFLEQIYSTKDRVKLQQRLIDYGIEWYADRSEPLPDYLRQFWIAHLHAAGDWQRIRTVLTEIVPSADGKHHLQPWQAARFAAEGSDTGYLTDLDLLWSWSERHNDFALILRSALIASSVHSRSGNLSPELLVQLIKIGTFRGKWSPAAVLEQIAHMPDPRNQADCLQTLVKAGTILPWQRSLEIACSITDEASRAQALSILAPLLAPDLIADALHAVQDISQKYHRAKALSALAPSLPPDQQVITLNEALLAIQNISDDRDRVRALRAVSSLLAPDQQVMALSEALQTAHSISDERSRAQALRGLASHLPPDLLSEVLQAAQNFSQEHHRAQVLSALIPHLPPNHQAIALTTALRTAHSISNEMSRAQALRGLASHLPPNLLSEALQTVQNISDQSCRAQTLSALAPYLPPNLLSEALQTIQNISDQSSRAQALTTLAPYLPPNLLSYALQTAQNFSEEWWRARALSALAPYLPPNLLTQVYLGIQNISDERKRARALTAIAPLLPHDQQAIALTKALQTVQNISDQDERAKVLSALAPALSPDHQQVVLADVLLATRSVFDQVDRAKGVTTLEDQLLPNLLAKALLDVQNISDQDERAEVLIALTPLLSPDQQAPILSEALQAACNISDEKIRAEALCDLAPHLPSELIAKALQAAQNTFDEQRYRAQTLTVLAPLLPPDQQQAVLAEALLAASNIFEKPFRAQALTSLAPLLPPDQQVIALTEALRATRNIYFQPGRARALSVLVPLLPPDLLSEALQAAQNISQEYHRAQVLTALAPLLPPDLLPEVFLATQNISDRSSRAQVLSALGPLLASDPFFDSQFIPLLHISAGRGRPELLSDLTALATWLIAIAQRAQQPAVIDELATAIIDTAHCWP